MYGSSDVDLKKYTAMVCFKVLEQLCHNNYNEEHIMDEAN